jgi:hypothetical protein
MTRKDYKLIAEVLQSCNDKRAAERSPRSPDCSTVADSLATN